MLDWVFDGIWYIVYGSATTYHLLTHLWIFTAKDKI
jgi:hypothetical protein